jgi:sugar phosphate isomerase/epimerase
MIRNTSNGGNGAPALRCYLNLMSLEDLAAGTSAPVTRETGPLFEAIAAAGYEGVQLVDVATPEQLAACARLKLGKAGLGRVNRPAEADPLAARLGDEGVECATLHVGWGTEDDAEAARLIDAILSASAKRDIPLYVETHRATIFQDMWRTVQFVKSFPELRFNGDFSHWYTGQEMVYGGFENKLAFIRPVLDRVRFIHGRIGNPGCMQVDVGDGDVASRPYVGHFKALWTASFRGFQGSAQAGDYLLFVPELLSPRIYYARLLNACGGALLEECDRWEQSLVLVRMARECFTEACDANHKE